MKAIIFDFDGTIIDTEHSELAAWEHIYQQYNHTLPVELWRTRVGSDPANFDPLRHLESLINISSERELILARCQQKLAELVSTLAPLPGVLNWIDAASQLGIRLSIASASPRAKVVAHLERLDMLKHFDHVVTANDVSVLKPNPEVYQVALKKMGVKAHEAIAIEDSPTGATAALAAELRCVIVPSRATANMIFPKGFRTLSNLEEQSLHDLFNEMVARME